MLRRFSGLDLEPESGRDLDQGLSGPEAEPEGSLGGVVVKGRDQMGACGKLQKESDKSEELDRRGNGWEATGKDIAMNEQRNNPGKGLLGPWERSQGIQIGEAKEGGVPEWRWNGVLEFRSEPEQRE
ncbi:hypothetical protein B0H14DRAFT_2654044 [Mycena olivaceomarginata]|nr:hypothetical protein B0H14DRAFT_2654044 [Mycena olivaceomarginata]